MFAPANEEFSNLERGESSTGDDLSRLERMLIGRKRAGRVVPPEPSCNSSGGKKWQSTSFDW